MKRFLTVLTLTTVIVGALIYFLPRDFGSYVSDITHDGTVAIYCRTSELDGIDMGNGKIVQQDVCDSYAALSKCHGVDGVSVTFDGTAADVARIIDMLDVDVVSSCELDGLVVVCGKSAKLRQGVLLDGNYVNIQIAYNNGVVTVGSPLILGSY